MLALKVLAYFIVGVCILFFLLGLKSQKGKAKGLHEGELAKLPASPNCVSSEADTQPERAVEPLKAGLSTAKAAVVDTGGIVTSEAGDYISATYMSKLFKFVDDVELRDAGNGHVHIRSASRVGYSDRGINRKRVENIRAALKKQIA